MAGNVREPRTERELQERIRRWFQHYLRVYLAGGGDQVGFAQALGVSKPTVSDLKNERVFPGLWMFALLHLRLGAALQEMLHFEPPKVGEAPTANHHHAPTKVAAKK